MSHIFRDDRGGSVDYHLNAHRSNETDKKTRSYTITADEGSANLECIPRYKDRPREDEDKACHELNHGW